MRTQPGRMNENCLYCFKRQCRENKIQLQNTIEFSGLSCYATSIQSIRTKTLSEILISKSNVRKYLFKAKS